ncbi:MAG: hypothetical protein NC936_05440 [Candidatus Omnitrophica bacterium]|nr:hypothetical protein [Candidatus Omnitrophota bacterium]
MQKKGVILMAIGLLGTLFVLSYDKLAGKPVNDITGPKSITALVICGILILTGIIFLKKTPSK